jgi:hypothetical protein
LWRLTFIFKYPSDKIEAQKYENEVMEAQKGCFSNVQGQMIAQEGVERK